MKVAVDTNVFIWLLSGDQDLAPPARVVLERASREAEVVVSPAVFAELVAGSRSLEEVARFFEEKTITVHWDLDRQVWREAGLRMLGTGERREVLVRGGSSRTSSSAPTPCSWPGRTSLPRTPGSSPTTSRSFVSSPRQRSPRNVRSKKGATIMALSNRDRVGRGLETLRAGLTPFVERELKARLRGDWRTEVERGSRYEMRRASGSRRRSGSRTRGWPRS